MAAELTFEMHIQIFESMSDASRMLCFENMTLERYTKGQFIVEKGGVGSCIFFVEKGVVKAVEHGRELRTFEIGNFFGDIAFVASAKKAFGYGDVTPQEQLVGLLKSRCATQFPVCKKYGADF